MCNTITVLNYLIQHKAIVGNINMNTFMDADLEQKFWLRLFQQDRELNWIAECEHFRKL